MVVEVVLVVVVVLAVPSSAESTVGAVVVVWAPTSCGVFGIGGLGDAAVTVVGGAGGGLLLVFSDGVSVAVPA